MPKSTSECTVFALQLEALNCPCEALSVVSCLLGGPGQGQRLGVSLCRDIKEIVEGPPHKLVETVAEKIAAKILEGHPSVQCVRVGIHKPQVAVSGVVESLGVEITRRRRTR